MTLFSFSSITSPFQSKAAAATTTTASPFSGFGLGAGGGALQTQSAAATTQQSGFSGIFGTQPAQNQTHAPLAPTTTLFPFSQQPSTTTAAQAGGAAPRYYCSYRY